MEGRCRVGASMEVRCLCTHHAQASSAIAFFFVRHPHRTSRLRPWNSPMALRASIDDADDRTLLSPDERARLSLRDLDDRLAELSQRPNIPANSPPRVTYVTEELDQLKTSLERNTAPQQVSTGFLFFIGTILMFVTLVNNLLFHFFLEVPDKEARLAQENLEKEQLGIRTPDIVDVEMKVAPQPY